MIITSLSYMVAAKGNEQHGTCQMIICTWPIYLFYSYILLALTLFMVCFSPTLVIEEEVLNF